MNEMISKWTDGVRKAPWKIIPAVITAASFCLFMWSFSRTGVKAESLKQYTSAAEPQYEEKTSLIAEKAEAAGKTYTLATSYSEDGLLRAFGHETGSAEADNPLTEELLLKIETLEKENEEYLEQIRAAFTANSDYFKGESYDGYDAPEIPDMSMVAIASDLAESKIESTVKKALGIPGWVGTIQTLYDGYKAANSKPDYLLFSMAKTITEDADIINSFLEDQEIDGETVRSAVSAYLRLCESYNTYSLMSLQITGISLPKPSTAAVQDPYYYYATNLGKIEVYKKMAGVS